MNLHPPLLVLCLDGCGQEYLEAAPTPVLDELARSGRAWTALAAVPTVTNVNLASLFTGSAPAGHGITGNSFLDPTSGRMVCMDSPTELLAPSMFARVRAAGGRAALVAAKRKLQRLLGPELDWTTSLEQPADWAVEAIGPPADIYSAEANLWVLRVAAALLERERPDLLAVATTDFIGHRFGAEDRPAREHFAAIDRSLGGLLERLPELRLVITADHGMNPKRRLVDLRRALQPAHVRVVPTIRDPYTRHHRNLGGSAYVYADTPETGIRDRLARLPGIELVCDRFEAAERFALPPDRIGDFLVLADRETALGEGPDAFDALDPELRTHGSLHEREVPVITWNVDFPVCSHTWDLLPFALGLEACAPVPASTPSAARVRA